MGIKCARDTNAPSIFYYFHLFHHFGGALNWLMRGIFGLRGKRWFGIEIYITCHESPVLELQARWRGGIDVGLAAKLGFGVKIVKDDGETLG